MFRKYLTVAVVLLLTLSVCNLGISVSSVSASTGVSRSVAAWIPYWEQTRGFASLQNNSSVFDEVSPYWYNLGSSGELVALSNSENSGIITFAHSSGKKLVPLVGNAYNGSLLSKIINNPSLAQNHINSIVNKVVSMGYNGIDVDYENVLATDKTAYASFIKNLASALHAKGKTLIVTLQAKTSSNVSWNGPGGEDYAAIGHAADKVRIMAYDYHWNKSEAGSVAPAAWVDQVVSYAVSVIPANKVVLGVPVYGYDWVGSQGKGITFEQAVTTAKTNGATIIEDAQNGPHYSYTLNGVTHKVWFEDAKSVSSLLDIVNKHNLNGIAIWRLGGEDAGIYPAIKAKFTLPATSSLAVNFNYHVYKSSLAINAFVTDRARVSKVQFFLDGRLISTDYYPPYAAYRRVIRNNSTHTIKVIAYDATGKTAMIAKTIRY